MPKTDSEGHAKKSEMPATLRRSSTAAQETFAKAHDSAADEYGEGERANRTAYSALKRGFEKVGDHWEKKDEYGPSDSQARGGASTSRPTADGVDANASKDHLYAIAKRLDISGRSKMSKSDLVKEIEKANKTRTRQSRR